MPAKWPDYKYNLHNFETYSVKDMKTEMAMRKIDYRDIVSITWIGPQVGGYYQVFYGLKQYQEKSSYG